MNVRVLVCMFGLVLGACGSLDRKAIRQVVFEDDFLEKTRVIMLKNEIRIYRHLSGEGAQKLFIEEFWAKRDPTPGTPVNENKLEFQRRLKYVDRWFKEAATGKPGRSSDRGQIYLLLGDPDERTSGTGTVIDQVGSPVQVLKDIWTYTDYRLRLEFIDAEGMGIFRLRQWPAALPAVIRGACSGLPGHLREYPFRFKADFKKDHIHIHVPTHTVSYYEKNNRMMVLFKIHLYIYRDYQRMDHKEEIRVFNGSKKGLAGEKNIELNLPCDLDRRGTYLFDIIMEDGVSGARYRELIRKKLGKN